MTDKIILGNISSFQSDTSAVAQYNANNATLIAAIDNTISRDGTSPNQMNSSLDMNSNRIVNLPKPTSNFDAVRLLDITSLGTGGSITVNPLPTGGTTGQVLVKNSSTNFDVGWGSSGVLAISGITLTPTPLSVNTAIVSTQTSPIVGSTAGPLSFNLFNITDSIQVTGSGSDSTGNGNAGAVGFRVNTLFTGNDLAGSGVLLGGLFTATAGSTTFTGDIVGFAGTAYTNTNFSSAGFLEGVNAIGQVGSSGSANIVVGLDAGAAIQSGGSATNRLGIDVASFGAVQASGVDAAIAIISSGSVPWKRVFAFSNLSGQPGIGTTTDMFWADTSYTIANVFNLPNMTVSGNIVNFPKVVITGSGLASFGTNTVAGAPIIVQATTASGGQANLQATTNSTTGFDGLDAFVSTGANIAELVAGVNEPNRTTTLFGTTMGSWGTVYTGTGNGLMLGTLQNSPIIIGTNNIERARVSASGVVTIQSTTAVPAGGTQDVGLLMSSTSHLGVFFGSGAPTLSAAQGSLYIRTDGSSVSTRMYVNTNGSTTWTNVTTAA